MNKQCTGCVVSAGTHKPAEALHRIGELKTQQPEALRLAEMYDFGDPAAHGNAWKSAVCTELRAQHARIAELEKDAARWRAATRDLEINDIAVCFFDKHGDEKIVMGDEADAAIDAAIAAKAQQGEPKCTSARES